MSAGSPSAAPEAGAARANTSGRGSAGAKAARRWWATLGLRERRALTVAALVLGAFALWQIALAPALHSLRTAPQRLQALEVQNQGMRALAADVRSLRGQAPIATAQSLQALTAATERLGAAARLVPTGDRAVLNFTDLPSPALMSWLEEVRAGARARPIEAQLQRGPKGLSGSLTVALPGAGS